MKKRFFIIGNRKIIMTFLFVIVGIISSFFMQLEFYKKFMYYTLLLIMGFFGGNAIEHIATIFKKESSNQDKMNEINK